MSDQSGKAWRKANPDKYRVYQRDLMRRRRAAKNQAPDTPAPEPMTQLRWRQMSEFERRRHLAEMGVDSQEKMVDYLRGLAEG